MRCNGDVRRCGVDLCKDETPAQRSPACRSKCCWGMQLRGIAWKIKGNLGILSLDVGVL